MQLHYNILWIDNDIQEYIDTGEVKNIYDFLWELGFEAKIITVEESIEFKKHIDSHKYDLIISDFNLNNTTGVNIIEYVRNEKRLETEILFYSAARDNFKDNQSVKDKLAFIDRVTYHHGRDTLLEKIESLINLTLNKLLELNATRGLITAATSTLDVIIEDLTMHLVNNVLNKNNNDLDLVIEDYATDFLGDGDRKFIEKHKKIGFGNSFKKIEAKRKWRIFRKLLKEYVKQDSNDVVVSFIESNKKYFDQVIDVRNKFAHAKEDVVDGHIVLRGHDSKNNFEFDELACIEIRKNLIQHKNNFTTILDHFGIDSA